MRAIHGWLLASGDAYTVQIWFNPTNQVLQLIKCAQIVNSLFLFSLSGDSGSWKYPNSAITALTPYSADWRSDVIILWKTKSIAANSLHSGISSVSVLFRLRTILPLTMREPATNVLSPKIAHPGSVCSSERFGWIRPDACANSSYASCLESWCQYWLTLKRRSTQTDWLPPHFQCSPHSMHFEDPD